jgi:formylmethanofuran dehydrogenase subunit E
MKQTDPRASVKEMLLNGDLRTLLETSAQLHGHYCPGLAFGVKAGYAGLKRLGFDNTGMEELLAVVECNNCFVDGVQMSTGCSLGNNALIYKDLGKTAVTILSRKTNKAVRLMLKPGGWDSEGASETQKEAGELFRRVVKERQEDPEASRRMRALFRELSYETVEKAEEDLFDIHDAPAHFPEYAPIVGSARCDRCGEEFMETKGTILDGKPICLSCAKMDCFAVLGRGICALRQGLFAQPAVDS